MKISDVCWQQTRDVLVIMWQPPCPADRWFRVCLSNQPVARVPNALKINLRFGHAQDEIEILNAAQARQDLLRQRLGLRAERGVRHYWNREAMPLRVPG
ncbi:hypothetical protein [Methylobacterium sp. 17Sr1-1]|uniref:hypothetical protein n=1 Tax=Methylobacterium sp. 17Sr1-1 TaxID=2202826 RepID=UPI0013A535FC|nr:hypothetical protein [Methylobacterium sp. 17Sr1-1]